MLYLKAVATVKKARYEIKQFNRSYCRYANKKFRNANARDIQRLQYYFLK